MASYGDDWLRCHAQRSRIIRGLPDSAALSACTDIMGGMLTPLLLPLLLKCPDVLRLRWRSGCIDIFTA